MLQLTYCVPYTVLAARRAEPQPGPGAPAPRPPCGARARFSGVQVRERLNFHHNHQKLSPRRTSFHPDGWGHTHQIVGHRWHYLCPSRQPHGRADGAVQSWPPVRGHTHFAIDDETTNTPTARAPPTSRAAVYRCDILATRRFARRGRSFCAILGAICATSFGPVGCNEPPYLRL